LSVDLYDYDYDYLFFWHDAVEQFGTHTRRKETKLRRKSGRTYGFIGCRILALLVCWSYAFVGLLRMYGDGAKQGRRQLRASSRPLEEPGHYKCEEVKELNWGEALIG